MTSHSKSQFGSKDLILGIDPGFSGALAFYDFHNQSLVAVHDMPCQESVEKKLLSVSKSRTTIDVAKLSALVHLYHHRVALAVIESVNASPGAGVTSMFRFGEGFGILQGVCGALAIRMAFPHPSVWKGTMKVTSDKVSSLVLARESVPLNQAAVWFSRVKDHGRAEAFLLALFGARGLTSDSLN